MASFPRLRRFLPDPAGSAAVDSEMTGAPADRRELIYLIAPSGAPNYGDEFIARAWLTYLAQARPDVDVVLDCHTPGQAAVLLGGLHPRLTFVDTAWRMCAQAAHLPAWEAAAFVRRAVGDPGLVCPVAAGIELMQTATTVHLLGGGYLNAVWPQHLSLLAIAAQVAARGGGRAVATGQGLTPVGDEVRADLVRSLAGEFTVFDVRDDQSLALLDASRPGVGASGDDAWLQLATAPAAVYDSTGPAVAREFVLCLQSDLTVGEGAGDGVDRLAAYAARLLASWAVRGEQVTVVEGIPGVDRVVFDRIAHLLPGAHFVPFTQLWRDGLPARSGQTWISTRFHPHLLAAAAGASGVVLATGSDYYDVKHGSLVALGSRWPVYAGAESVPPRPSAGGFTEAVVARQGEAKAALARALYPGARR
ncbi:polysaccharide pyruvyl transferase family protein [Rhodococcus kronopolitis]|uniref:Polysaccharide pyruvyl transferase family protein n=1 Tax=Rhodococcus kronopolitis TaxID=1460226 RepID=A0ABV9FW94_9NOCA